MKFFVDSSAFIALEDRSDQFHDEARSFFKSLQPRDRLFTSNYVIDEVVTRLRYTGSAAIACDFGEKAFGSRILSVLQVDRDTDLKALSVMKRYDDKRLSFTDCTSIVFMKDRSFDSIFAFDQDFKNVGLRTVPDL